MSPTHDMIIDNSTGANVRADLNNALAALVSNSSSSSEPSTKYAYQFWADTNTGILKIRNSANNDWVELLQLDGTLTLEDGSVSAPALAFRDDLNTGIFSSAADTFNIATAGVERMELGTTTIFNEDGADVNFRIEGDTEANLFFIDAGDDNIGIATGSPNSNFKLDVNGAVRFGNTTDGIIIENSTSSPAVSNACRIHRNGGTGQLNITSGTTTARDMIFNTKTNAGESMRIDSSGNVGIGTTSPDQLLHLAAASNGPFIRFENTDTTVSSDQTFGGLEFESRDTSAGSAGVIAKIDCISSAAFDGTSANGGELRFHTSGTNSISLQERIRIDATGNVGIGTTSPGHLLHLKGTDTAYGGSIAVGAILELEDAAGRKSQLIAPGAVGEAGVGTPTNHDFTLFTNNTERMRIDTAGRVLIGATANIVSGSSSKVQVSYSKTGEFGIFIRPSDNNTGGGQPMLFQNQAGTSIGSIGADASNVSFNTSSDYRLKENDVAILDGITRLKKLRPIRFNWKITPEKTQDGFFAHEVSEAVPEAVTGEKDGTEIQQLDNSKLVPLLVAAVQELITKVETLEAA